MDSGLTGKLAVSLVRLPVLTGYRHDSGSRKRSPSDSERRTEARVERACARSQ
jgi:hypothetical protein